MKVKIKTGKRYRPTCIVDVEMTTFRGGPPLIEIDSPISINPIESERPEILNDAYEDIAKSIFGSCSDFKLDEGDICE